MKAEERHASGQPHLLRKHIGATAEYQHLRIVNYEMEAGTLFKMGLVYGFAAGCVCAAVAQRTSAETIVLDQKAEGVDRAIRTAIGALELLAH
jgi:uridine phosphorylase